MNRPRPKALSENGLLSQISTSDVQALLCRLTKLYKLTTRRPLKDRRLWEKAYEQEWSHLTKVRKNISYEPSWFEMHVEERYQQLDADYVKVLGQRDKKAGQIIEEIERILRSRSAEVLLRYDTQHGGNLRTIARQIANYDWHFTGKTIAEAMQFLLQVKRKLPLWYDKPTESKPTEGKGGKTDLARVPISELIKRGEGHTLEFKETLEYDIEQNRHESSLNKECLKTIAAFLNTDGGTLLIGVKDSGEIGGIEREMEEV